jgi:hypothetical protein
MRSKAVKESILVKKLKFKRIKRNATRGASNPIDLDGIKALQREGVLKLEDLYENIGSIFPFILNLVSEGESIRGIERIIGVRTRVLEQMLQRIPYLAKEVKKAKQVRVDRDHDLIDIFS